jgi:hypothetical protein
MRLPCLLLAALIPSVALAQTATLVKDIDTRHIDNIGSDPIPLGRVGSHFLFSADLGPTGRELYRVSGSNAVLVRDTDQWIRSGCRRCATSTEMGRQQGVRTRSA